MIVQPVNENSRMLNIYYDHICSNYNSLYTILNLLEVNKYIVYNCIYGRRQWMFQFVLTKYSVRKYYIAQLVEIYMQWFKIVEQFHVENFVNAITQNTAKFKKI